MKMYIGEEETLIEKHVFYAEMPEDVLSEKLWFHFAFIYDEEAKIKLLASTYKSTEDSNNSYPPGSIIVSNKIYNEFPIAQGSWTMENCLNRMYVDIKYRNKGITVHSGIINDMVATKLDLDVKTYLYSAKGSTDIGNECFNRIYDLGIPSKKIEVRLEDIFQFRNYLYPIAYMDKRLVYVEDTTK